MVSEKSVRKTKTFARLTIKSNGSFRGEHFGGVGRGNGDFLGEDIFFRVTPVVRVGVIKVNICAS